MPRLTKICDSVEISELEMIPEVKASRFCNFLLLLYWERRSFFNGLYYYGKMNARVSLLDGEFNTLVNFKDMAPIFENFISLRFC
jgi:hypothetical protein